MALGKALAPHKGEMTAVTLLGQTQGEVKESANRAGPFPPQVSDVMTKSDTGSHE